MVVLLPENLEIAPDDRGGDPQIVQIDGKAMGLQPPGGDIHVAQSGAPLIERGAGQARPDAVGIARAKRRIDNRRPRRRRLGRRRGGRSAAKPQFVTTGDDREQRQRDRDPSNWRIAHRLKKTHNDVSAEVHMSLLKCQGSTLEVPDDCDERAAVGDGDNNRSRRRARQYGARRKR